MTGIRAANGKGPARRLRGSGFLKSSKSGGTGKAKRTSAPEKANESVAYATSRPAKPTEWDTRKSREDRREADLAARPDAAEQMRAW